jgi:hypothetical protein
MRKQTRIPSLPAARASAEYWDAHSLAEHVEDTKEATIRFLKRPKRAISIRLAPECEGASPPGWVYKKRGCFGFRELDH